MAKNKELHPIEIFAKSVIDSQVLMDSNTKVWVPLENLPGIFTAIINLFRGILKTPAEESAFENILQIKIDHLTEVVRIDFSELPLNQVNTTKEKLAACLEEYNDLAQKEYNRKYKK